LVLRELDNIDGPIDLVAHDWGAILALRVTSLEPTLVRTWAVAGAPSTPSTNGQAAKLWQTPEIGDQVMERLTPETLPSASSPPEFRPRMRRRPPDTSTRR